MNRIALATSLGLLVIPAFVTTARCADLIDTYEIAEEAYVYAFPMIASYKAMYEFFIDKASSQYKGPFNQLVNEARVFTPKDTAVVTPNSDTPYSIRRHGSARRADGASACPRSRRRATTRSSSSTCTPSTSATSAAARPATAPAATWSPGPAWKGETPRASRRSSTARPQFAVADLSAPSCSAPRHRQRQEGPGRLPNADAVAASCNRPAPPRRPSRACPTFTRSRVQDRGLRTT